MRHTSHWDRTKYLYTLYMIQLHVWSATSVHGQLHVWLSTSAVMISLYTKVSFMRGYTGNESGMDGYRYRT